MIFEEAMKRIFVIATAGENIVITARRAIMEAKPFIHNERVYVAWVDDSLTLRWTKVAGR